VKTTSEQRPLLPHPDVLVAAAIDAPAPRHDEHQTTALAGDAREA
jgi:hypothetical protein